MEGVSEDPAYFLPRGFNGVKVIDLDEITESRLWIAYRGDTIDNGKPPLKVFLDRGYRIASTDVYPVKGENAFLILLEK
jgi:hypothetical protein